MHKTSYSNGQLYTGK